MQKMQVYIHMLNGNLLMDVLDTNSQISLMGRRLQILKM